MRGVFPGLVAALVTGAFMPPPSASAQTVPSPYRFVEERQELGAFAGYLKAGTGRFGFGPPGGLWLGARYGLEVAGPLSIEAVAGAVKGTRDIISPGRPEGDRVVGEGDVLIPTIDGRLKLSVMGARAWNGLSPFLVFGGGLAVDVAEKPEADALIENDEVFDFGLTFFGTAGVGTRWFINRNLALRTDAIFSLWKLTTPPGFGDPQLGLGPVSESEWVSGLSITGSLLFRW
jgi:hypothetical protein